ncbi:hypothetical protein FRC05_003135 [Tulasnella sp. 425]|nr:hypothetical protein FRC05_003135 [Tulasnella sp. 425]
MRERSLFPTLTIVFRDGLIYYVATFAMMIFNIVFLYLSPASRSYWFIPWMRSFVAIMGTRLLLNLRGQIEEQRLDETGFMFPTVDLNDSAPHYSLQPTTPSTAHSPMTWRYGARRANPNRMNQISRFDGSAETIDASLHTLLSSHRRLVVSDQLAPVESVLSICTAIQSAARGLKISLRRQWNTRQPVYQLPNELLHDILYEALEYDRPHHRPGRPPNYLLRQQALRRVSSHWNQVILSSPQFWNTLSCVDFPRKRFSIALERSRDTGLNLICRPTDYCQDFAARMIPLSHRWGSLDTSFGPIWEQFSSLPNSGLRHLTITHLTRTVTSNPQLPQLSKLQSLTIVESWDMKWSQIAEAIGNGLRSLELRSAVFDLDSATLLGLIAESPALERLKVIETPLRKNYNPVTLPKVSAPSLRYFWWAIDHDISDTFDLLARISMPATTSIHLKLTEARYNLAATQNLFGYLCDRIQMLNEDCSVQVQSRDEWEIAFTCPSPCTQVDAHLRVKQWTAFHGPTFAATSYILEPVMRGQRELDLSETGGGKHVVSSIFLPWGVRLVGLSRLAISNFPEFLKPLIEPQEKGGWVFPGLQHLRIVGGEWEPLLLDLVRVRRDEPAVRTIESVILKNVDVNEASLDRLRSLVSQVSILN